MPTANRRHDVAAHRNWRTQRVSPAYMRGIPSWIWETALAARCTRPQAKAVRAT